jgi:hypothetical protein
MPISLIALAWSAAAVVVQGTSACPSPAAVSARLDPLLPVSFDGEGAPDVARLEEVAGALVIHFSRGDGSDAGSRTIAGDPSCTDLADAAAVVIASWQQVADWQRTGAQPRDGTAPKPPDARAAAAAALAASAVVPARDAGSGGFRLSGGVGAGAAAGGFAPAALISIERWWSAWGIGAEALASGRREEALSGGTASWRRASLVLMPRGRVSGHGLEAQLHAGAGLSWLAIAGQGFSNPRSTDDLVAVFAAAMRVAAAGRASWRPWLEIGGLFWPVRPVAYQLPDGQSAQLGRFELLLSVGLSYGS